MNGVNDESIKLGKKIIEDELQKKYNDCKFDWPEKIKINTPIPILDVIIQRKTISIKNLSRDDLIYLGKTADGTKDRKDCIKNIVEEKIIKEIEQAKQ